MSLLRLEAVRKRFGGITALDGAGMAVESGSIHGLVGPNGAGKSTLVKVAAGELSPDAGEVRVDGDRVTFQRVADAQRRGIVAMPQELSLASDLSVEENIVLGVEPHRGLVLDRRERRRTAEGILGRLGLSVDPGAIVSDLPPSEQRMVMFAHALHREARVMVLDEPTAAMSLDEARVVLAAVRTLQGEGIAVVYVSHRLDEIIELCDRVTILRDGATLRDVEREDLTKEVLVSALVADQATERPESPPVESRPTMIVVDRLVGEELRGVDLEIRAGEVLGVAGLPGSGAGELLALLAGRSRPVAGGLQVAGKPCRFRTPADAIAAGISYLPGERREAGFMDLSLRVNVLASKLGDFAHGGYIRKGEERKAAADRLQAVSVDPRTEAPLSSMSGGNQQRALVARCIAAGSKTIVLDDPMAGVDVGARQGLRRLLVNLAREGNAIVVGASEPDELSMFADRVVVLARGRVVKELVGEQLTPEAVLGATISDELSAGVSGS